MRRRRKAEFRVGSQFAVKLCATFTNKTFLWGSLRQNVYERIFLEIRKGWSRVFKLNALTFPLLCGPPLYLSAFWHRSTNSFIRPAVSGRKKLRNFVSASLILLGCSSTFHPRRNSRWDAEECVKVMQKFWDLQRGLNTRALPTSIVNHGGKSDLLYAPVSTCTTHLPMQQYASKCTKQP